MMRRDGFSFKIWRVRTCIAHRLISAAKRWRHLPSTGGTAPLYNAVCEGCPGWVRLHHQHGSSEGATWPAWETLAAGSGTSRKGPGESTARTRDSVTTLWQSAEPSAHPYRFIFPFCVCQGTLHPVFCRCNCDTISSAVLSCDATVLG